MENNVVNITKKLLTLEKWNSYMTFSHSPLPSFIINIIVGIHGSHLFNMGFAIRTGFKFLFSSLLVI